MQNLLQFAEKYQLAYETAIKQQPQAGLCGLELEWNLLDNQFHPLLTVGSPPAEISFVDYLRAECIHPVLRNFSQLEVFHWMIEWATRPFYSPQAAAYEGRLMEATLVNALDKAGRAFGQDLYYWHGNLLSLPNIDRTTIPGSWHIAKRRYLERCVNLYGPSLATAGTHVNLSLPDPLLAWDFMHLPASQRLGQHLDDYKSTFYITATRLMRAFAGLFIATSAATPLQAFPGRERSSVVLTEFDSVRNLTFPNPSALDVPNLYRSYEDYLQISYELVRSGLRFGNNNWTPVRARSFAEPVERLIAVTSEQLADLYARGLYVYGTSAPIQPQLGESRSVDEMAHQIEMQNLMARINLPMARVEVRTDDGYHSLEEDTALLALKHLLLVRFYGDPTFARSFRYDAEDISRARRGEDAAARFGLQAEIENPFNGKKVVMKDFLAWTLSEIQPLADALGLSESLEPLRGMASGELNASGRMRKWLTEQGILAGQDVPLDLLTAMAKARQEDVRRDVGSITAAHLEQEADGIKLGEFTQRARDAARQDVHSPIRFRPGPGSSIGITYPDKTSEIVDLAQQLIRIPSVTACPDERLDEVRRASTFIYDYLRMHGVGVRIYDHDKYPALLAGLPEKMHAPFMLCGHFDVVEPEPDDSQFNPSIEGNYLSGRGAADMKTVVATYLVWMKDALKAGPPYPAVNLLLVGNEENGEMEPMGSPHVLRMLSEEDDYAPGILVAGERTGEKGDELFGEICTQNRGVMRMDILAFGTKGHSGVAGASADLTDRLLSARAVITDILHRRLTLSSPDGWQSQVRFPFIQVGTPGIYNVTPHQAILGVEVRSIPQDDISALCSELDDFCRSRELELRIGVQENGVACDPENPYLTALVQAVADVSGEAPRIGRKLPGTSARFAPGAQGVVWGQTGIGPHSKDERHFIPSIMPYYQVLNRLGQILSTAQTT
jgi:acetylornithine deacetylase/succinyl-diaminopimelate desuccinylase-like protein/gamma-glutamyl:cysteine ligase YbdK (ATP-grasp superfamily)